MLKGKTHSPEIIIHIITEPLRDVHHRHDYLLLGTGEKFILFRRIFLEWKPPGIFEVNRVHQRLVERQDREGGRTYKTAGLLLEPQILGTVSDRLLVKGFRLDLNVVSIIILLEKIKVFLRHLYRKDI